VKSTRFTEHLNFEKELKSTVWGIEFQQLITRSLKKLARRPTQLMVWRLQSLNLWPRVYWQGLKTNRSSRLTQTKPKQFY